jgi:hypothetical protein
VNSMYKLLSHGQLRLWRSPSGKQRYPWKLRTLPGSWLEGSWPEMTRSLNGVDPLMGPVHFAGL